MDTPTTIAPHDNHGAIVIDNGASTMKAGFAGSPVPFEFPTIVGRIRHKILVDKKLFVGSEVKGKRGLLYLNNPIVGSGACHWDDLETVWSHTFQSVLRAPSEEHPLLLTEISGGGGGKDGREKTLQIMFEKFHVPAVHLSTAPTLAMLAVGRTTGVVVDSGEHSTCIVPISDGVPIQHAALQMDVGGYTLSNYLRKLIAELGYSFPSSTCEFETTPLIKEALCYAALDFEEEMSVALIPSVLDRTYELPDGQIITLGSERFRCAETLFQPSLVGIEGDGLHQTLCKSIMACSVDLYKPLFENIVLCGGNTMFSGLGDRLQKELMKCAPQSISKVFKFWLMLLVC
jgi:actin beta/gamma 1